MNILVAFLTFARLASALWPTPSAYDHGDTVLFLPKHISFHWYEARRKLPDRYQQPMQFETKSGASLDGWDKFELRQRHVDYARGNVGNLDRRRGGISGDEIVEFALRSARKSIYKQSLYPWKFYPRGWKEPSPENHSTLVQEVDIIQLVDHDDELGGSLSGEMDESYTLSLCDDGKATIRANSSIGIARGLTTFIQLFYATADGKHIYTPLAPVKIYDAPRFQHRGLNLDVSRNWFSVADIKRQIDALAFNKMNRFHLHITDSQSWPLEIPAMPELSAKGAYRPDLVYTPHDFEELQHYAAIRGVELITEIDMPGHTSSIYHSYPDLIAAFNKQPDWQTWAAEPPSGTLKLNSTTVYDFLDKLFSDLLPRVSPYTRYFHTGGDEVNKNAYTLDDTVKSSDFTVLQPLMQTFIDRNHDQIRAAGLTPIVWEEMLLEWNLTLGSDVIVQSWRSDEAVAKIVQSGHKVIAGNYQYWYLDCGKGQWLSRTPYPYADYCAPYHNWRLAFSYDPLSSIPAHLQHLVIGGEAHMWSEQTDPVNVDQMVWPRAAAVAGVLWSGAKDEEGRNRSQSEAGPRIMEMRERLVDRGVRADAIGMAWCTMEGGCEF
ncbi:glycoside hydrolase superfamily [Phaeosphaeria sp. MPI-PUGE-AT-0046c]|nr:glycoside hydrolase superfamily [Phaeosphaeria sp. MPI-PUGE-AT-0046c]